MDKDDSLKAIVYNIFEKYHINYAIEQVTLVDGIFFRLKKRHTSKFFKRETFEYEHNLLGHRILFENLEAIKNYLIVMYSEPEGFNYHVKDLDL